MVDALLGLEIGTTATKAVLFDLSGTRLAAAERAYGLNTPQAGWVEQDPEAVWQALVEVLQDIVNQTGPDPRILALAMATQAGSTILARADGTPLYPMITWMDRRSEQLVQEWREQGLEPKIRRISGWLLHPGLPLPTIAWLGRYRPDIFAAAERVLSLNDYLIHRLTGHYRTDLSCGAEMQLVDLFQEQWSPELCALAGIKPAQLSRLRPSGTILGPVTPQVSRLTGLSRETLVVNGGHDHSCEALAMGMTSAGKALLTCGTAWVITGITARPAVASVPAGMDLNFHVVPQRWTVSQLLGSFGASTEWWLNQAWQGVGSQSTPGRTERYTALNVALEKTEPGNDGLLFLPLSHPYGGFFGLRLDHTRADMSRAILEGAAMELRRVLEQLGQAGLPVLEMWLAGGATRSPVWPRIIADVTGLPLTVTEYGHWAALGAAILAGVGANAFESYVAGQARLQKPVHPLSPDKTRKRIYDNQFATYQKLRQTLSELNQI